MCVNSTHSFRYQEYNVSKMTIRQKQLAIIYCMYACMTECTQTFFSCKLLHDLPSQSTWSLNGIFEEAAALCSDKTHKVID